MKLFDRYLGKEIDSSELPILIDLGRYCYVNQHDELVDITNSNFDLSVEQYINQDLLDETNYSIQKLFQKFKDQENKAWLDVNPILQKTDIKLTEFEKLLLRQVSHLEAIVRQPHYLLDRTIEKVPTSRAKRIPNKSYQYLSGHTEDWSARSIVNFKPSRVLTEELEINYNVYENQLFVAFVQRTLIYLSSRIKETADLQDFLKNYKQLLDEYHSEGWYKKIHRNLTLIGSEYDDGFTNKESTETLSTTAQTLKNLWNKLCAFQDSDFYESVDLRSIGSLQLRNTNVLVNHQHYRFLRDLWQELDKARAEQTEEEKIVYEQETISGLRSYVRSAIIYTCKTLGYDISGNCKEWKAKHDHYPIIYFVDNKGIFTISIGDESYKFITVANESYVGQDELIQRNIYLFEYGPSISKNDRVINVSPFDADTIERIGKFIKETIINQNITAITCTRSFPPSLSDFIDAIHIDYIELFIKNRQYRFINYPNPKPNERELVDNIKRTPIFVRKNHPQQQGILKDITTLINDIDTESNKIKKLLYCPNCLSSYRPYDMSRLSYIQCPNCQFILDSSSNIIRLHNSEDKYKDLSPIDWGMDYIEV